MKKFLLIACAASLLMGCNDKTGSSSSSGSDSSKVANSGSGDLVYPYTLDHPYRDWQPGDQKHAITVMASLKAFENNDLPNCFTAFGDSVEIAIDGYRDKMSHDSLTKFFTQQRAGYKTMKVKMQDWESVIAKDKKDEWVTLWYKEFWTDKTGKADSLDVIDDAKMVNGKIVLLDEKIQHYPPAKK